MALAAVGLAILSAPLVIRMQLFVGETIAFLLLLVAIHLYLKGSYKLVSVLIFLIGFTEEFTLIVALGIVFLSAIACYITLHDSRRLKWSAVIIVIGLIPESALFFAQGPAYRLSFVSEGFLPYPNPIVNSETAVQFMGVLLPLLALVGFLFYFRPILTKKFSLERIVLLSWFAIAALYTLFPPLLPSVAIFRTLDYLTLPASLLASYALPRLFQFRRQSLLLIIAGFAILSSVGYAYFLHRPTLTSYVDSLGTIIREPGILSLVIVTAIASSASVSLVFWKSESWKHGQSQYQSKKKLNSKAFIGLFLLIFMLLVQTSFYSQYEANFYASYLTSGESTFLGSAAHSIPPNAVIATNFVLGANVAAITNRTVKDIPAFPTSAQGIVEDIENASIYSEQFATGVVPLQLQVPLSANQPVYLVVLSGYPGILYTYPPVLTQLLQESRFALLGSSGSLYLFSVNLNGGNGTIQTGQTNSTVAIQTDTTTTTTVLATQTSSSGLNTSQSTTSSLLSYGDLTAGVSYIDSLNEPGGATIVSFGINAFGGSNPYTFVANWSDGVSQSDNSGTFTRIFSSQTIPTSVRVTVTCNECQPVTVSLNIQS
jgi:hypothetical protein